MEANRNRHTYVSTVRTGLAAPHRPRVHRHSSTMTGSRATCPFGSSELVEASYSSTGVASAGAPSRYRRGRGDAPTDDRETINTKQGGPVPVSASDEAAQPGSTKQRVVIGAGRVMRRTTETRGFALARPTPRSKAMPGRGRHAAARGHRAPRERTKPSRSSSARRGSSPRCYWG